jgi:hypothetical protein
MAESRFQAKLIKDLRRMFPGCIILKNDANYLQGVPDLTILWEDKWATLESKDSEYSDYQPNQEYYVDLMNQMSFSAFIYPSNKDGVLDALQHAFGVGRESRVVEPLELPLGKLRRR